MSDSKQEDTSSSENQKEKEDNDEELERLAIEALLCEAKRGKARAEEAGPMGWQKCQLRQTNKRFINTVVADAVTSNKRMKLEQHTESTHRTSKSSSKSEQRTSVEPSHKYDEKKN